MTSLVKGLFGAVGSLFGGGGSKAQAPEPLPQVTRDDAAAAQSNADMLARRKGSIADMLTGTQGAQVAANQVGKLVGSS